MFLAAGCGTLFIVHSFNNNIGRINDKYLGKWEIPKMRSFVEVKEIQTNGMYYYELKLSPKDQSSEAYLIASKHDIGDNQYIMVSHLSDTRFSEMGQSGGRRDYQEHLDIETMAILKIMTASESKVELHDLSTYFQERYKESILKVNTRDYLNLNHNILYEDLKELAPDYQANKVIELIR